MVALSTRLRSAALDAAQAAMVVADSNGIIRYSNQQWRDFCVANGGPVDGYEGQPYIPPSAADVDEGLAALANSWQALLKGELDNFQHDYPCDAPGERRWFAMKVSRMVEEGEPWAVVLHVQVGSSELKVSDLMGNDPETTEFKDRLLRLVAHQFRTPITPIRMDASRLALTLSGSDQDAARRVERNARRLEATVTSSLELLKLQQRGVLRPQMRLGLLALRQAAEAAGTKLGCTERLQITSEGKDAPVSMDLAWMGRAVAELVANAAKFSDGDIRVQVARNGGAFTLHVEDDGIGFEPGTISFQSFEVDASTENTTSGAGLGLAIVQKVVDGHEGHLHVHSDGPGKGARFTIELSKDVPRPSTDPTLEAPAAEPEAQRPELTGA